VDGREFAGHGRIFSVRVDDLDLLWAGIGPDEPQPPLIVDADAVLPFRLLFRASSRLSG
jgi:hypothetical protein